jgi:hypothetical protein
LQDTKDMLIITGFSRGLSAKRQGLSSASARSRNRGGQEALSGSNCRRLGRLGSRARCAGSRGDRWGLEDVLTTAEINGDGRNRRRMAAVLAVGSVLTTWRRSGEPPASGACLPEAAHHHGPLVAAACSVGAPTRPIEEGASSGGLQLRRCTGRRRSCAPPAMGRRDTAPAQHGESKGGARWLWGASRR